MHKMKSFKVIGGLLLGIFILMSCTKNDSSTLKVYVRSSQNNLETDAYVRVVGEKAKGTPDFYKEGYTNESGYVSISLDEAFSTLGNDNNQTAYFRVYATDTSFIFTDEVVRAKAKITTTHTIVLKK